MRFGNGIFALALLALLANSCGALDVSPDWDPDSLRDCSVNRHDLIDRMFDMFDLGHQGFVNDTVVYCVFNADGVFTDAQRELVDGGADSIVLYCDGNADGILEKTEVLHTHTCVGNCPTAQTLGIAIDMLEMHQSAWEQQCF